MAAPTQAAFGHDEWLAWTLAAWSFPGEHAERVGCPAFPEELPRRLIKLLSFLGDLIIDPFVGSGTTAVVARALRRRFWGCDRNPIAVALAQARVAVAEIHASRPASGGLEVLQPWTRRAFQDAIAGALANKRRAKTSPMVSSRLCAGHA